MYLQIVTLHFNLEAVPNDGMSAVTCQHILGFYSEMVFAVLDGLQYHHIRLIFLHRYYFRVELHIVLLHALQH